MDGRRIWITGASSGIGRATARELSERGARLALTARSDSKLQTLSDACSNETIVLPGDVTETDDILEIRNALDNRWGGLDVAFLNAGVCTKGGRSFRSRQFHRDYAVNVLGLTDCIEAARPLLDGGEDPQLIGMSSMVAYRPLPGLASYGSSKAAAFYLLRSLQQQWSDIDVSVVCPGFVETEMTGDSDAWQPFMIETDEAARQIADGIESRTAEIHFPKRFTYLVKFASFFPYWLQLFITSFFADDSSADQSNDADGGAE